MNIFFRVDSSSEIGHGHLMRCLVLAQELALHGAIVHFICRDHTGSAHALIKQAGHYLHLLPGKRITIKCTQYSDWLGCSQVEDALACSNLIKRQADCHVIVDHYSLDITWESKIPCTSLTVIDDLANRRHRCTQLIDQSLTHRKEDYDSLIQGSFRFWGNENVLLRSEFRNTEWQDRANDSLLVCMGGADPHGYTLKIVAALVKLMEEPLGRTLIKKLDVVIGSAFYAHEALNQSIEQAKNDVCVHHGHPVISSLMARSSLSILSCGTMILEACALGVPAIGIPIAENQGPTASFLEKHQAILLLEPDQSFEQKLKALVKSTLASPKLRTALSCRSEQLVNRDAVTHIATEMIHGR